MYDMCLMLEFMGITFIRRNIFSQRRKVIGIKSSFAKQLFRKSGNFPDNVYCVV